LISLWSFVKVFEFRVLNSQKGCVVVMYHELILALGGFTGDVFKYDGVQITVSLIQNFRIQISELLLFRRYLKYLNTLSLECAEHVTKRKRRVSRVSVALCKL